MKGDSSPPVAVVEKCAAAPPQQPQLPHLALPKPAQASDWWGLTMQTASHQAREGRSPQAPPQAQPGMQQPRHGVGWYSMRSGTAGRWSGRWDWELGFLLACHPLARSAMSPPRAAAAAGAWWDPPRMGRGVAAAAAAAERTAAVAEGSAEGVAAFAVVALAASARFLQAAAAVLWKAQVVLGEAPSAAGRPVPGGDRPTGVARSHGPHSDAALLPLAWMPAPAAAAGSCAKEQAQRLLPWPPPQTAATPQWPPALAAALLSAAHHRWRVTPSPAGGPSSPRHPALRAVTRTCPQRPPQLPRLCHAIGGLAGVRRRLTPPRRPPAWPRRCSCAQQNGRPAPLRKLRPRAAGPQARQRCHRR